MPIRGHLEKTGAEGLRDRWQLHMLSSLRTALHPAHVSMSTKGIIGTPQALDRRQYVGVTKGEKLTFGQLWNHVVEPSLHGWEG
ncbi:hypothetical protein cyc_04424 [Cyclospora cayetanensis]|uniref:Uncharacterized protein n=1 Tax=Cyclospora cayetanensis TaxID=88456 RepID=A0A1D3CR33_9EIME|nr:hypothetical protein cyc_04424 [Cyclospora cayetanensis]